MTTGEKIVSLRKEKGLTQEQLANTLNISRQSLSKWESDIGLPDTFNLIALSDYFNVSIDYLLRDIELVSNDKQEKIVIVKEENKIGVIYGYLYNALILILFLALCFVDFEVNSSYFGNGKYNLYTYIFNGHYEIGNLTALVFFILFTAGVVSNILYLITKKDLFKKNKKIFSVLSLIINIIFIICTFGISISTSFLFFIQIIDLKFYNKVLNFLN